MMGMMVVHGAQAGGFSPISIYGTITNSVMRENNLPSSEITVFVSSLVVNLILAAVLFVVLGGRQLAKLRLDPDDTSDPRTDGGGRNAAGRDRVAAASGTGASPVATTTDPVTRADGSTTSAAAADGGRRDQVLTLVAFVAVAAVALVFDKNIGFVSITAAVLLSIISPGRYKDSVKQIAWPTVLLVAGVSTYAAILTKAGSPEFVGNWAAGLGAVVIGALVLCYVGGIVSAFASSTALLPVIIPIGIPLVANGGISAGLFVAALAVCSTIVDVSPFSTNGALMLANRPDTISEPVYYKQILRYSVLVTLVGPLLVWAGLVLPGW